MGGRPLQVWSRWGWSARRGTPSGGGSELSKPAVLLAGGRGAAILQSPPCDCLSFLFDILKFHWLHHVACGILVP